MTDFPPPSDRPKAANLAALRLFRPVLFAVGAIGVTLGALLLIHRPTSQPPSAPAPAVANVVLPDPEPVPPLTTADFKGFQLKLPDTTAEAEQPASDRYELTLRLEQGDTVEKLLADIAVPEADRKQINEALQALLKKRTLAVGEALALVIQTLPDQPDAPRVLSLSVRPQPEHEFLVMRKDDGTYAGEEKIYKVSPRIVRVEAEIQGSLQQSGVRGGAPVAAMNEFIKALSYDVDFQRELKAGQHFTVLLEQLVTSDGKVTHQGRLLAGELRLLKRTATVVRFRPLNGADQFYNAQGESVMRSFLRTPMDASHITSHFGMREHPILGFSAMHTGVDFGAPMGTPILAAGAGKVTMAGPNAGYGIFVKLQHTQQIGTGYGHMSRLGPGIRPGATVRQGQVVGFVGSTGMSTGPHLHYEFYRDGHPVNPLTQKFALRAALAGKDLGRFQGLTRGYLNEMKSAPHVAETVAPPPEPKPRNPVKPQLAGGG
jgi:murein DD-endopeptidase MepM/ murein hydrolase activator NlpD